MRNPIAPSSSATRWTNTVQRTVRLVQPITETSRGQLQQPVRNLAQVRPEPLSELWFTSTSPRKGPADELLSPKTGSAANNGDHKKPDERTLKLGKTLRTLSPLLPTILTSPLPPEILSPSISLHLFPSTHPHLPTVKGRVAYRAALWTAPVAWGCMPIVGNVRLQIVSEKIVRTGYIAKPHEEDKPDLGEEKLVVRWKTEPNPKAKPTSSSSVSSSDTIHTTSLSTSSSTTHSNRALSSLLGGTKPIIPFPLSSSSSDQFSGLFIFGFDSSGRVATHTIEHADENNGLDRMSKVVTLTDWLLGKARWGINGRKEEELVPGLGLAAGVCRDEWRRRP